MIPSSPRLAHPLSRAGLLIIFLLTFASIAAGASWTWNGAGGNVNWTTGANWGGTAPTSALTTDLVFDGSTNPGTSGTPLNQNILNPFLLRGITYNSGAATFYIGGQALQYDANGSNITQNSSSAQYIANNIDVVNKIGNDTTTIILTGNGTGIVTLSGAVSPGSGQRDYAISKTGTSTFVLSGANGYGGGTSVSAGTLLVNNTTGSGTGSGAVTVNGSGSTLGGTGIISGTVTLGNTAAGAILNPGQKGTAGTSGAVGTLSTGSMTMTGTNVFHIDASGTASTSWDKLNVTGAVTLGTTSTLEPSIASGLVFTWGSQYTIIANDGTDAISGTFSNAANGSTITAGGYMFTVNYAGGTGNDLVLTEVPEPATWLGGTLALIAIAVTQHRRLHR
ncbi:MAG: large repetitive protein [Verrucomicrobiota bacterium]|jgi:autotransporter-associated beta strand protein